MLERSKRLLVISVMVSGLLLPIGCGQDPAGPGSGEARFVVRVTGPVEIDLTHRLAAVGMDSGELIGWSPSLMWRIKRLAVSVPDSLIFVFGNGPAGWTESQVVVVDWQRFEVVAQRYFADEAGYRRDDFDGMAIPSGGSVAVSPDGRRLFIGGSQNAAGEWGVAVLDAWTLEPNGFVGPFEDRDFLLVAIPQGEYAQAGAIVVTVPSSTWPYPSSQAIVVNPVTMAVSDTIDFSSDPADGTERIVEMLPGPNGTELFVRMSSGRLLKYDLLADQIVASVPLCASRGRLAVSPDGTRLYFVAGWTHDWRSPGVILVYDSGLNQLPSLDLSGEPGGSALNMAAVKEDGDLIVVAGAAGAQLWGQEAGRILMVDPLTGGVRREEVLNNNVAAKEIFILR
jgi:hypothetical protein